MTNRATYIATPWCRNTPRHKMCWAITAIPNEPFRKGDQSMGAYAEHMQSMCGFLKMEWWRFPVRTRLIELAIWSLAGLDFECARSFILWAMETLTVKEASDFTGLTAHTLRYYERVGLIQPVARNAGGHRRYAQTDLEHLKFLHCLRDSGMSIQGMQQYATLASQGHVTMDARLELLESHKREVRARIHELEDKLAIIDAKIKRFHELS